MPKQTVNMRDRNPVFIEDKAPPLAQDAEFQEIYGVDARLVNTTDKSQGFAKRVAYGDNSVKYFVKFSNESLTVGALDPYGLYYIRGDENKIIKATGKVAYEYRDVTQEAFDLYIKFLRTRNKSYLRAAERLSQ